MQIQRNTRCAGCKRACPYSQIQDGKTTNIFTNTKKYKIGKLQIINTNRKKYKNTVHHNVWEVCAFGASNYGYIHKKYKSTQMGKLLWYKYNENTRRKYHLLEGGTPGSCVQRWPYSRCPWITLEREAAQLLMQQLQLKMPTTASGSPSFITKSWHGLSENAWEKSSPKSQVNP